MLSAAKASENSVGRKDHEEDILKAGDVHEQIPQTSGLKRQRDPLANAAPCVLHADNNGRGCPRIYHAGHRDIIFDLRID